MLHCHLRPAPALLAIALAIPLAVFGEEPAPVVPAAEPAKTEGAIAQEDAQIQAEAAFAEATAAYRKANFVEARELVEKALAFYPPHRGAQQLRQDILGVLSHRGDSLAMAASWFGTLREVAVQEKAVQLAGLVASGDRKMAAGDYAGAEMDYDRVDIGLRTFPYRFDWGTLPQEVSGKKLEARQAARKAQADRSSADREDAALRARRQSELQEEALRNKVDEMIRRAKVAYARKDYRRSEVDAWNAYELDRRRDDARELYLASRREGHVAFDAEYRTQRLERIARVHEEIHKALIPQNEMLVYPEDWSIRSQRKPTEIGTAKAEPWMAALKARLEQPVTLDFRDTPFDDVIALLRQLTGINIVVDPKITVAGAPPVTLKVTDMKIGDALKWILEPAGLQMAARDEAIYISNEAITGSVVLRLYDVTDLTSPVGDFPGKELAFSASGGGAGGGVADLFGGGGGAAAGAPVQIDAEQLVEFIKTNIGGEPNWDQAKGFGITKRGGNTLFVSHTPETHHLMEELLSQLRNQGAIQVSVNVRMLEIRKGFFEEIGVAYRDGGRPESLFASGNSAGYANVQDKTAVTANLNPVLPSNRANYSALNGNTYQGLQLETTYNATSFLNLDQVRMVLTATEDENDGAVLEHPALTLNNGQRANAMFINQYAYIADYTIVTQNYDPVIEILNYGSILDVRPVVSSDHKYITMEIRPSSVRLGQVVTELLSARRVYTGGGGGALVDNFFTYPLELPTLSIESLRSTVMIPDRGTLLIGGFTDAYRQRTHTGIPFLSHIPFLGRLFSTNGVYDSSRRVFFLLNASILFLSDKEAEQ